MTNPPVNAMEYPGGVLAIDTGFMRDRKASSYLLEAGSEAAFIETGTNASVPRLMEVLRWRGWLPEQVRYVIVTHVHLDHAGGAGRLMQALPEATLLVHPRGAGHMIDPSRLEASVRGVYGDEVYDATYGTLIAVAAERARSMQDGESVNLGERKLTFIDTPGHARHHFCVWDEVTRGWFTGDTFGLSYRDLDTEQGPFIFPTTTPIEFDPHAHRASIGRLLERQPECAYLTHFGRVTNIAALGQRLLGALDALVEIAERHRGADGREQAIRNDHRDWLIGAVRAHGVTMTDAALLEVLESDVRLNAQGVECWLDRSD
ncbi:MAG: MBL fold metallo-hydrolase [Xanthomonadales bacterium]|nr:MBL fold metallo-hydrolase [Xanthomonadales bacterium]NIN58696.1 MBL fold metallo-hydrolase [Xanthomonadales bacterium]NIN73962.1 MBL fold metallo-hydrolase [Xanthomonadales bacterium]NIO12877.1 MBL fold metallo-hydrolase [Xanthomonadales bacterium]NIP11089.1 MBL fold metallo-hydrolase [Xanthomonadales bacterium]